MPAGKTIHRLGAELNYFMAGPVQGKPLVLCHGLAASGLQFVEDAEYFAQRGFRVLVPDLRGHGASEAGPSLQTHFAIASLADDVLAMLDAEHLHQVDWAGNSLGGILGLEIMGRTPRRIGRFASFGTAYNLDVPGFLIPLGAALTRLSGTSMMARFLAPLTCSEPHAQAIISAMLKQVDVDGAEAIAHHVRHYDLTSNALNFAGPILMLRCALDHQVNVALGDTLAALQGQLNFKLVEIDDAGHCGNLDQPADVRAALMGFLSG